MNLFRLVNHGSARLVLFIFFVATVTLSSALTVAKGAGPFSVSLSAALNESTSDAGVLKISFAYSDGSAKLRVSGVRNDGCLTVVGRPRLFRGVSRKKLKPLVGEIAFKLKNPLSSCETTVDFEADQDGRIQSITKTIVVGPR